MVLENSAGQKSETHVQNLTKCNWETNLSLICRRNFPIKNLGNKFICLSIPKKKRTSEIDTNKQNWAGHTVVELLYYGMFLLSLHNKVGHWVTKVCVPLFDGRIYYTYL